MISCAPPMIAAPYSPVLWQRPDQVGAPRVAGLHLQFGADASNEVVVSWHTTASVSEPGSSWAAQQMVSGTPR
ncbi:MAG: hypothetical protein ACRDS0_14155 [Pseudonocardiaceae bacterium]